MLSGARIRSPRPSLSILVRHDGADLRRSADHASRRSVVEPGSTARRPAGVRPRAAQTPRGRSPRTRPGWLAAPPRLRLRPFGAPRVAVAREIQRDTRRVASRVTAIDVREPRLAGRGARPRDTLADQRVDQVHLPTFERPELTRSRLRRLAADRPAAAAHRRLTPATIFQWVIVSSTVVDRFRRLLGRRDALPAARPARSSGPRPSSEPSRPFNVSSTFFGMSARSFSLSFGRMMRA